MGGKLQKTEDETAGGQSRLETVRSFGRRLIPSPIRRNYLLKLLVSLALVVVLVAGVGLVLIEQTTGTLDQQVADRLEADAQREGAEIANWIEQHVLWLNELSKTRQAVSSDPQSFGAYLSGELRNVPEDVRFVSLIDRESYEIQASNVRQIEGEQIAAEADWLAEDIGLETSDDVFVSDVYWDRGVPAIAFVTEVEQRPGVLLVATVRAQAPVTFESRGDAGFTTVVDRQDRIVMDQRGSENVLERYGGETALTGESLHEPRFYAEAPNQATLEADYVAATAPVPGTDLLVIRHAPAEEVYLIQSEIVSNLLWMLLISLVGLLTIGVVIANGTVRSIDRLAQAVEEMEQGNLETELSTNRIDEIGQLYGGFRNMRQSLQRHIEELSAAVRAEERMRLRLAETNEQLENQRLIISVLHRLLRHNLRNSMTTILLTAEEIKDGADEETRQRAERILGVVDRLSRRAEKSKAVERVVNTEPTELQPVSLRAIVESSAQTYRAEFPEATVRTTVPEDCYVRGGDGLEFVVDNLLENALQHNDFEDGEAELAVEKTEEWVQLIVTDNGPGIPAMEIEVLEAGEETPLEHGSGIGLWLIDWLVTHMGGEVSFADREPRGTRVVVELPRAESTVWESEGPVTETEPAPTPSQSKK